MLAPPGVKPTHTTGVPPMRSHRATSLRSVVVALAAVVVLVSCNDSGDSGDSTTSDSPSTTTSAAAAGCEDVTALKTSVQTLTEVKPIQDGTNALEAAVENTRTALAVAVDAATAELQPAVEQVQTQFDRRADRRDRRHRRQHQGEGARHRRGAPEPGHRADITGHHADGEVPGRVTRDAAWPMRADSSAHSDAPRVVKPTFAGVGRRRARGRCSA